MSRYISIIDEQKKVKTTYNLERRVYYTILKWVPQLGQKIKKSTSIDQTASVESDEEMDGAKLR